MLNEFIVKLHRLDKVDCCFNIVAVFGNNVERNIVLSTKSKQTKHIEFVSTLLKKTKFRGTLSKPATLLPKRQQCRSNIRLCRRIVRLVAFDNVASTLLLVWTGLNCGVNMNTMTAKRHLLSHTLNGNIYKPVPFYYRTR